MNKKYLSMAVACGLMLSTSLAFAADVADFGDEEVVVTATRTEKKDIDVAAATEVVTAEEIHAMGAKTASDVLKHVNGIQYDGLGSFNQNMGTMTNDVIIRGYKEGSLVMMNGQPISYRGKYDLSSIDAKNIERIEIIKNGGSVLYGSEAVGGVVNIITKKGAEKNSVFFGFGNRYAQQYGATIADENFRFSYSKLRQKSWFDVSSPAKVKATGSQYAELRYYNHDLSRENFNFSFDLSEKWDVMYNYAESIGNYDRMITSLYPGYHQPAQVGEPYQTRQYTTTQHNMQVNFHDNDWKATLFNNVDFIQSRGDTYKFNHGTAKYYTKERNHTYGIDAQKTLHFNKSDVTAGFTGMREAYDSTIRNGSVRSNYDRNNWAVFAQLEQKVDDKNTFTIGGRETWTTGAFRNQNYSNFSAAGSWLHKMDDENSLYVSVTQSFMMPTFSQMYKNTDMATPNPDLKPQKGLSYELGWKQAHGAQTWKAALFHTYVKDNITASWETTPVKRYQYNNVDFRNTGIELSCHVENDSPWSFDYGVTYQHPETKSDNVKKLNVKDTWENAYGRLQLDTGVTYKMKKFTSNLSLNYQCMRFSSETGPNKEVKPYLLSSLNFVYEPDASSELSLAINNVLSRRDRTSNSSSDYYTEPATFMFNYTYKF